MQSTHEHVKEKRDRGKKIIGGKKYPRQAQTFFSRKQKVVMSNKRGTPLDAHLARKRPFIAARDAPLSSQSYNRASSGLAESVNVVVERPAPPDSLTSLR